MTCTKKYKFDWCVKITPKNMKDVRAYLRDYDDPEKRDISDFAWSNRAYYGITSEGRVYGNGSNLRISNNVLSSEEFYRMSNQNKKDNYEMY